MKKIAKMVFTYFFRTLGHPVTLISIFGPPFLVQNLNWLQVLLNPGGSGGLYSALQNGWSFAISDYILQSYTLLLVMIIYYVDIARNLILMIKNGYHSKIGEGGTQITFLGLSVAVLVAGIITGGLGVFGQPSVVEMYYPDSGQPWGQWRWPPMASPITVARGIMLLLGFYLPYWKLATKEYVDVNL